MGRTVMNEYRNKRLEGLELFMYFMKRFNMSPQEALADMKEHGQDTKDAELFVKMLNKTKQTERKQQMNKNEPLPVDNTGTGKLGSIRVLTKKEKAIQKECIKQLNKYWTEDEANI